MDFIWVVDEAERGMTLVQISEGEEGMDHDQISDCEEELVTLMKKKGSRKMEVADFARKSSVKRAAEMLKISKSLVQDWKKTRATTSSTNLNTVKLLFQLAEYRLELYYAFGLLCLASWFAFNLWILRDYFFPCWFKPIYTEKGLSKQKLQLKKQEIMIRNRVSVAFVIPVQIGAPIGGDQITGHNPTSWPVRNVGQQRAQSVTTTNNEMLSLNKQRRSLGIGGQILAFDRNQPSPRTPLLERNTSNSDFTLKFTERKKTGALKY